MRKLILIVTGVILAVGLIVLSFTYKQTSQEQASLVSDLEYRTRILADSLKESVEPAYLNNSVSTLQKVVDKFADRQRLSGLIVLDNKGENISATSNLSKKNISDIPLVSEVMDGDKTVGGFAKIDNNRLYLLGVPLHDDDKVVGSLVVIQKADYIDAKIADIWRTNFFRFFLQSLLFALAIIIVVRFLLLKPLLELAESVRQVRSGQAGDEVSTKEQKIFGPLSSEIYKLFASLKQARSAASEEARLRLEKLDTPWTVDRLKEFIKARLKGKSIYVVSNREPYIHKKVGDKIQCLVPASGMVTALESVMEACGGTWLAYGSGSADKLTVDKQDKIQVPPDEPQYTLKRIWLTQEQVKGFYVGFSNEALWPLCHMAHNRPIFRQQDWAEYKKVNGKFAAALLREIKNVSQPVILIQDFHFALLPEMIKASRPDAEVFLFWHIPWPSPEAFGICPWRKEILGGMLGADVVGFHTQQYCNNFIDTVNSELESLTDFEHFSVTYKKHSSFIKPFPISIDFTNDDSKIVSVDKSVLLKKYGIESEYLGLGVDRLDYTKGIMERFKGIDFFFKLQPEFREKFTFLQIAPLSRTSVLKYQEFSEDVIAEAERINKKYQTANWQPIVLRTEHHTHAELNNLYKLANVCMVTSLSDGMNLVAKEYVAERNDELGVLILSQFTGSARSLKGALIINPYSAEETAKSINEAITMPASEQHRRMKKMRESVKDYNVYRWAAEFLRDITSVG